MIKALALATVVASTLALWNAPGVSAAPPAAPALEGTWIAEINLDPSLPFGEFVALETYNRGGGLVTTNDLARTAGVDVGQGAWERINADAYRASIVFFVFNPDGSRAGRIEVSHTLSLTTKRTYVGEGQATLRATNGAVIATGSFTSTGRKMAASDF